MNDVTEWFWSMLLRLAESAAWVGADLLAGCLLAATLWGVVGRERGVALLTRTGAGGWAAVILLGVAWPTGSAGAAALFVLLWRGGIGLRRALTAGLVAGVITPWGFVWALDRQPAGVAVSAVLAVGGAMLVAWVVSLLRREDVVEPDDDSPAVLPILVNAGRLARRTVLPVSVAVVASAATAASLPGGEYGHLVVERDADHFVLAGLLPVLYVISTDLAALGTAEAVESAIPGVGGAMLLGSGLTLALPVLLVLNRRPAAGAVLLGAGLAACLVIVLAGDVLLWRGVMPGEDSHAFDPLARPYHPTSGVVETLELAARRWDVASAGAWAGLVALLVLPSVRLNLSTGGNRPTERQLAVAAGLAGVMAVFGLTYVFFASPAWRMEEMRHVRGEISAAAGPGETDQVLRLLDEADRLTRRAKVGATLRGQARGPLQTSLADLRDEIGTARGRVMAAPAGEDLTRDLADFQRAASRALREAQPAS